ncbi:MAG: AbrB family transcriptional regulator [Burkholderiales bacterium]
MIPFLKALLVAVPAGALFSAVKAPLPWTIGPLLACAAVNVAGGSLATPVPMRLFGLWMLGTVLGLYFSPAVVERVAACWPWILLGVVWSMILGLGFSWTLRRFAKVSRPTAFFGGAIGGASEMAMQGERAGGRVDLIAAAHSMRIVLVVLTLPSIYRLIGLHGTDDYQQPMQTVDLPGLLLLAALTVAAALLAHRLKLPNAFMLGPMTVALLLTASGHSLSAMPSWLIIAGQVTIGASLGCRFSPGFFSGAPRLMAVVAMSTLVGIGLSALFALLIAEPAGISLATMVLATSPGGIAEMALIAKTLQLGVPVVTAFHITRMASTVLLLGGVYRLLGHLRGWND